MAVYAIIVCIHVGGFDEFGKECMTSCEWLTAAGRTSVHRKDFAPLSLSIRVWAAGYFAWKMIRLSVCELACLSWQAGSIF